MEDEQDSFSMTDFVNDMIILHKDVVDTDRDKYGNIEVLMERGERYLLVIKKIDG